MSASEKSAVKSILAMHRTYAEIDEYLEKELREAGYAGVDIQKNPIGSRITVYVTRPGLAIGRRGTGIKDLTERVAAKFPLPNPQIAVSEVEQPELNPRIMAARTAQIVARGTAFRRAATWTMNSIMAAGASGVEIGVAGKLRSDRSHSEKYRMGVVPKSGEASKRVVREATTDVLLKLGLYGIQVKIALKDLVPPMVEYMEQAVEAPPAPEATAAPTAPQTHQPTEAPTVAEPAPVVVEAPAEKPSAPQEEVKPAIHTKTRRRQPKPEQKSEPVEGQPVVSRSEETGTVQTEAKAEEKEEATVEAPAEATVEPAAEAATEKAEEPAVLETVEQVAKSESKES
jgi:small subunit ribosomal protein S3